MSDVSGYGRLVNGIYRKQLRNSVKISNLTIVTKNRKLWDFIIIGSFEDSLI